MSVIKNYIQQIKLILLILLDLIHRCHKACLSLWHSKHEFERICDCDLDIYEKAFLIDRWLDRTSCWRIREYLQLEDSESQTNNPKQNPLRVCIAKILKEFHHEENVIPSKRNKKSNTPSSSKSKQTRSKFLETEDQDAHLVKALKATVSELIKLIKTSKHIKKLSRKTEECLNDILFRILVYRATLSLTNALAKIQYDSNLNAHTSRLLNLWNNLVQADQLSKDLKSKAFPPEFDHKVTSSFDIVSNRWSHIGFQGEDPGTDFRGMGVLGLIQLEYLSTKSKNLPIDLLKRSLDKKYNYPMAIVGINITYNLLYLYRDGYLKHLYYDDRDVIFRSKNSALNPIKLFNDIYVELFLRFDCFWHESKPDNIFAFKELMEKFMDIIRMDLSDRNFSFKFIY